MGAYARIKTALQAVGDSTGGLLKLFMGDPTGDRMEWPTDQDWRETLDPGQMWQADSLVWPEVLSKIGDEIDDIVDADPWAYIDTKSSGNAPEIKNHRGVSGAVKSTIDSPQSLTITVANAYDGVYWAPVCASVGANAAIIEYTAITASTVKIALMKHDGTFYGIDDQFIIFRGIGTLSS